MVTIGMNYVTLEGKEDVFERAFAHVLGAMKDAAGHSSSRLFRDVHRPNAYLIISEWNDQTAFDGFVRSEEFAKVTQWGKEQVLAERPRHQTYAHL